MSYDTISRQDGSGPINLRWHPDLEERYGVQASTVALQSRPYPLAAIDTGTTNEWTLKYVLNPRSDGGDLEAALEALCDERKVLKLVNRLGETSYIAIYAIESEPMENLRRRLTVECKRSDVS